MQIGIVGSGVVGQTLGAKIAQGGHKVALGTRNPKQLDDKKGMGSSLRDWLKRAGPTATVTTFADAAKHGEVVINATAGAVSVDAMSLAGEANLAGKILIDVSNPLDFSQGMPPTLTVCNTDSIGEQLQRAFPNARVVKTLNTLTAALMIDPSQVGHGNHNVFVSGDDAEARAAVTRLLGDWFGWKKENVIDLGDITTSRGAEMVLPLWLRVMMSLGSPMFNFRIVR